MSLTVDSNYFLQFPPILRQNFENLIINSIGFLPFNASDISFIKTYEENDDSFYFYYTLKIPFAGHKLNWDLIFTPEDISFAPDFKFNDENFYLSENLDTLVENVPSLMNWDVNNPMALLSVMREYFGLYKKQQVSTLENENIYSTLNAEYKQLIDEVSAADVEVFLTSTTVTFVIIIRVDVSELPQYIEELKEEISNPGDDICLLKLCYIKLDGSKINTNIQLSPRLRQIFTAISLPHQTNNMNLSQYVASVRKYFQDQVKNIENHFKLKMSIIDYLLSEYPNNICEFDAKSFNKAVLMADSHGYRFLVHLEIGAQFPKEKPLVTVETVYCTTAGYPCTEEIQDYPYSPRWPANMMVDKIIAHVVKEIETFKAHKH